jgi:hypothetical protein
MKLGLLLVCAGSALIAQKVVSARAGLITYLQGPAFVDGKRVVLKTARFPQMKNGETLSTGRGRAELLLAPGVVLRLSDDAAARLDNTQLDDTHVTLQRGDALIEILQLPEGGRIHVDLAKTSTEFTRPGLYRFGISPNETGQNTSTNALRVYGGEALVRSGPSSVTVKRGMAVQLDGDLTVFRFNRKQTDLLHAWAARRSFELFMTDPDARRKQNHWEPAGQGYVENKNFGVQFRAFLRPGLPPPVSHSVPSAEHEH